MLLYMLLIRTLNPIRSSLLAARRCIKHTASSYGNMIDWNHDMLYVLPDPPIIRYLQKLPQSCYSAPVSNVFSSLVLLYSYYQIYYYIACSISNLGPIIVAALLPVAADP
jgi:hypothetical protein